VNITEQKNKFVSIKNGYSDERSRGRDRI